VRLSRRKLLGTAAAVAAVARTGQAQGKGGRPVAISSANGLSAVELALRRMQEGDDPLDAAVAGVNLVEDEPADMTVGYGGFANGRPKFDISFYALDKSGRYGSAVMYAFSTIGKRRQFAVADASGARKEDCAFLFERR